MSTTFQGLIVGAVLLALAHIHSTISEHNTARDIQILLKSNFTYVEQLEYDEMRFHSGEEPFEGDCDDYAMAAFYQFVKAGRKPLFYYVRNTETNTGHAIVCTEYCVDNTKHDVFPVDHIVSVGYVIIRTFEKEPYEFF